MFGTDSVSELAATRIVVLLDGSVRHRALLATLLVSVDVSDAVDVATLP